MAELHKGRSWSLLRILALSRGTVTGLYPPLRLAEPPRELTLPLGHVATTISIQNEDVLLQIPFTASSGFLRCSCGTWSLSSDHLSRACIRSSGERTLSIIGGFQAPLALQWDSPNWTPQLLVEFQQENGVFDEWVFLTSYGCLTLSSCNKEDLCLEQFLTSLTGSFWS